MQAFILRAEYRPESCALRHKVEGNGWQVSQASSTSVLAVIVTALEESSEDALKDALKGFLHDGVGGATAVEALLVLARF